MYQISIKKDALKELQSLPKRNVVAITGAIEELATEPRPSGCKKLVNSKESLWQIRVGDYRVIYLIDDIVHVVNVRKIGHRKDIYQ